MTLVLNGKGLLLEGSNPKIEDKQVTGIHIYTYSIQILGMFLPFATQGCCPRNDAEIYVPSGFLAIFFIHPKSKNVFC